MKPKTLFFSSLVAAAAMSAVPALAANKTITSDTTISAGDNYDTVSVQNSATVTQNSGTATFKRLLLHTVNTVDAAETYNLNGGVLNITGGTTVAAGSVTENSAGIIIGHWAKGNTSTLSVASGAVLNAVNGWTLLSWDTSSALNVYGEVNLYGLSFTKCTGQSPTATLTLNEGGRLNLGAGGFANETARASATNKVVLNGGTLGALDSWSASVGMTLGGNVAIDTTKRTTSESGVSTADSTGVAIALSGVLADATDKTGSLTVSGAGTLTLSGANTFTGGVTISSGKVIASNATALGTGNVSVASGAALSTVSGTQLSVVGNLTTESGSILGVSAATTEAAAITVTGTVSLAAGTLFDFSSLTAGETLKLVSGSGVSADGLTIANLYVNGALVNQRGTATFTVADGNVLTLAYTADGAATLTWDSSASGAWENAGTRTWTPSTAITDKKFYNGDSVIFSTENADVKLSGAVAPAEMTVSAATTLSGSGTVSVATANLTTSATLTLNSGVTLDLGNLENNTNVQQKLAGSGTVVIEKTGDKKDHNQTINLGTEFAGTVNYTGNLDPTNVTSFGSDSVSVNFNDVYFWSNDNKTGTIANTINFSGTGNKIEAQASAKLNLTGNITFSSGALFTVAKGTLDISGAVTDGNFTQTGGTLTFSGSGTQAITTLTQSAGTLNISGTGTTEIGTFTQSGGTANFSGTGKKTISGKLVNYGTVKVGSGTTLNITGTGTGDNGSLNWNTFVVEAGGSANFTTDFKASAWSGGNGGVKTLTVGENATLNVGDTMRNAAGLTLTNNGLITAGTIDYSSGNGWGKNTVSGNGYIVAGTFNIGNYTQFVFQNNTYVLGALTVGSSESVRFGNTTIGAKNDWSASKNVELTGTAGTEATTTVFNTGKFDTATKAFSNTEGYTITLSGVLSGVGGLTKTGAGTLTLSGENTFEGGVTISAGKLVANNNSALGAAAGSVKLSGGQLEISSSITLAQTNITIALSDAYSGTAAILGEGALADGTTITLTTADEAMASSLAEQTTKYQIFASGSSLASSFSIDSFTLDTEAWADWKISEYDTSSGVITLVMIPEPSTFGLLAGVGALALVVARRRRRSK